MFAIPGIRIAVVQQIVVLESTGITEAPINLEKQRM